MAPPNAPVRRAFTSTKTSTRPSSATKSNSPNGERRLRATIRYPLCRKYCSAAASPFCPKLLLGSRVVTDWSLGIRLFQFAQETAYGHPHIGVVQRERTTVDELRRDHVERVVANALRCHTCLLYTSPSPRDRQKSRMP